MRPIEQRGGDLGTDDSAMTLHAAPETATGRAPVRPVRPSADAAPRLPLSVVRGGDDTVLSTAIDALGRRLVEADDDLELAGREVVRVGVDLFGEAAVVWLIGPDRQTLDPLASYDADPVRREQLTRQLAGARPSIGTGVLGTVALVGEPRLLSGAAAFADDVLEPYTQFVRHSGVSSLLALPLLVEGTVVGVAALLRTDVLPDFTEVDVPAAESFAQVAARHFERAELVNSAVRSQSMLDALEPAVIATDIDRRVISWNSGAERLYGIATDVALGQRLDTLVPTDPQTDPAAPFVPGSRFEDDERWRVVMHDGEWQGRVRQLAADGRVVDVEARMTLLAGRDGRVAGGITLAREYQQETHRGEQGESDYSAQSVIDALPGQLAIVDDHGRVVATNLGWEERCHETSQPTGAWVDAGPGNDFVTLLRSASRTQPQAREALAGIEGVLAGRLTQFGMDYEAAAVGEERSYTMNVVPLRSGTAGIVVTHTDITWRKTLERQLSHRATHDALTGLPNRLLLGDRLTQALVRSRRSGRLVAVMFVDLDQFKAVNDTLGHAAGDQVLVAVSRRLMRACRASDSVTRFGGDEFVLVVEDVDSLDNVHRIAQRILDSMTTPIVVDGSELYFGASIGVAVSAGDAPSPDVHVEGLLRDADTAMYRAKEAGRNTFVVFDPDMRERVAARLALTTTLRHAVSRNELRLHFQPQFSCSGDDVVGAEALVRWQHPDRGMVPPLEFIEAAEESGIIVEIGAWVLDEACRQAAVWQGLADDGFTVHVNLSPRQLADANVVPLVRHTLARHGVAAHRLGLEITEGALMDDPEAAARTLEELHALGVQIAVDDFGTGYSSLAYLQRFPVNALKIDRFFVSRVLQETKTAALVRGIVGLADALGLATIAEGVETEEQRRAVEDLGCGSFQGFLKARPGPADVITGLLESQRGSVGSLHAG